MKLHLPPASWCHRPRRTHRPRPRPPDQIRTGEGPSWGKVRKGRTRGTRTSELPHAEGGAGRGAEAGPGRLGRSEVRSARRRGERRWGLQLPPPARPTRVGPSPGRRATRAAPGGLGAPLRSAILIGPGRVRAGRSPPAASGGGAAERAGVPANAPRLSGVSTPSAPIPEAGCSGLDHPTSSARIASGPERIAPARGLRGASSL